MKLCLRCNQYFEDGIELCPIDSSSLEAVGDHPLIGALINDRYVVDSVIGKGSTGIVYKATRLLMGSEVAVKVLHSYLGAESGALDRFLREARAASRLRHPHIINIWESGVTDDGQPYFVMDYLEGMTLADLIKQKGFLHPTKAVPIIQQVCEALAEAHRQNIIHRDIKPENIVLQESHYAEQGQDFVKVLDFGIADAPAGSTDGGKSRAKVAAGSPAYMSPEQCQGFELDQRSDIYSLGIVVFEMLTGLRPYNAEEVMALFKQHVSQTPPTLASVRPDLKFGSELEAALAKALAKKPDRRQQSIKEFQKDLEEACRVTETTKRKVESASVDLFSIPMGDRLMDDGPLTGSGGGHNFMPGPEDWPDEEEETVPAAPISKEPTTRVWSAPASASSDSLPKITDAPAPLTEEPAQSPAQEEEENGPAEKSSYTEAVSRLLKSAKRAASEVSSQPPPPLDDSPLPSPDVSNWAREVLTRTPEAQEGPGRAQENFAPPARDFEKSRSDTGDLPVDSLKERLNEAAGAEGVSPPEVSTWAQRVLNRSTPSPDDPATSSSPLADLASTSSSSSSLPASSATSVSATEPLSETFASASPEPFALASAEPFAAASAEPFAAAVSPPITSAMPAAPPSPAAVPPPPPPEPKPVPASEAPKFSSSALSDLEMMSADEDLIELYSSTSAAAASASAASAPAPVHEPEPVAPTRVEAPQDFSGPPETAAPLAPVKAVSDLFKPQAEKPAEVKTESPSSKTTGDMDVPKTPQKPAGKQSTIAEAAERLLGALKEKKTDFGKKPEAKQDVKPEPAKVESQTQKHDFSPTTAPDLVNREPQAANPFAEAVDKLLDASILPSQSKTNKPSAQPPKGKNAGGANFGYSSDDLKRFNEPVNKGAQSSNSFSDAVDSLLDKAILPPKGEKESTSTASPSPIPVPPEKRGGHNFNFSQSQDIGSLGGGFGEPTAMPELSEPEPPEFDEPASEPAALDDRSTEPLPAKDVIEKDPFARPEPAAAAAYEDVSDAISAFAAKQSPEAELAAEPEEKPSPAKPAYDLAELEALRVGKKVEPEKKFDLADLDAIKAPEKAAQPENKGFDISELNAIKASSKIEEPATPASEEAPAAEKKFDISELNAIKSPAKTDAKSEGLGSKFARPSSPSTPAPSTPPTPIANPTNPSPASPAAQEKSPFDSLPSFSESMLRDARQQSGEIDTLPIPDPLAETGKIDVPKELRADKFAAPAPAKAEEEKPKFDPKRFSEPVNKTGEFETYNALANAVDDALDAVLMKEPLRRTDMELPVKRASEPAMPKAETAPVMPMPEPELMPAPEPIHEIEPEPAAFMPAPDVERIPASTFVTPPPEPIEQMQMPTPVSAAPEDEPISDAVSRLIEAAKKAPEAPAAAKPEALNKKIEAVKKKIEALKAAQGAQEPAKGASMPAPPAAAQDSNSLTEQVNRLLEAAQKVPESGTYNPVSASPPVSTTSGPYGDFSAPVRTSQYAPVPDMPINPPVQTSTAAEIVNQALKSTKGSTDTPQDYYSGFVQAGPNSRQLERKAAESRRKDRARARATFQSRPGLPSLPMLALLALLVGGFAYAYLNGYITLNVGKPTTQSASMEDMIKDGRLDQAKTLFDKRIKNLTASETEKMGGICISLAKKLADQDRFTEAVAVLNKVPRKYSKARDANKLKNEYRKKVQD